MHKGDKDLQKQNFREPLPSEGSNLVEMMLYKLKGVLQQNDGEQYYDNHDRDDIPGEPQPVNIMEFHNDELAVQQSSKYAEMYDNQVIYIESYRRRGRWLDASYKSGSAYFSQVPEENVVDKLGVKWRVKNVGGGDV